MNHMKIVIVCTFRPDEVLMDRPIYLGVVALELSKLLLYETYYDNLQLYFGQNNFLINYIDTDGMIISMITQRIIKDLDNLEDIFDFSNIDRNHELFSNRNEKVVGKFKIEVSKNFMN